MKDVTTGSCLCESISFEIEGAISKVNPENIKPIVYNELTEEFELHPKVRKNYKNKIDLTNGTYTFETQALGQFALAEINH